MTKIKLSCSKCLNRNYNIAKSNLQRRLELNKFCPKCNRQTLHKEEK